MNEPHTTKAQLLEELLRLRQRVALLEQTRTVPDLPPIGSATPRTFPGWELLEASADGVVVIRNLIFAYVNPAFCAMVGYEKEDLLGKPGTFVLTDACKERVLQNGLARIQGQPAQDRYELEYNHRDGHTVPAEVHIRLIRFEGAPSSLAFTRDITERKRTEDALRESEARLRGFFEAAFEGIALHENGKLLDANQAFADMYGYSLPETMGMHANDFTAPEDRERVRQRIASGDERPYEGLGLRKDGTTFPVELRGKNILYRGHTVRVTALRDITERKRTEELLRQYTQRLQTLSRRLLQVQEEERQHLARELHDEIGQALTGLQFTLELGERLNADGLRENVRAARGLVRDLTARVRELSLRLRPTMLDDLGLLPALLWHFGRYTTQTGVRVAFTHHGLGRRFAREREIAAYRVVQEALTNVARHADVADAAVRLALNDGLLRLEIEDGGKGFDPEAALASGQGCGLSGMRQRVGLLGGRFTLVSTPGAGTRLSAELPVNEDEEKCDDLDGRAGR